MVGVLVQVVPRIDDYLTRIDTLALSIASSLNQKVPYLGDDIVVAWPTELLARRGLTVGNYHRAPGPCDDPGHARVTEARGVIDDIGSRAQGLARYSRAKCIHRENSVRLMTNGFNQRYDSGDLFLFGDVAGHR